MSRTRLLFALLAVAAILAAPAVDAGERPVLTVESSNGQQSLWVEVSGHDGDVLRQRLRVTAGRVEPGPTGADSTGAGMFANWIENGGERWTAFSRDGGRTWAEARPIRTSLRLLAGDVPPGRAMPAIDPALAAPSDGSVFVVQFRTLSLPEYRAELTRIGAEILQAFPHHGHVIRLDPALASRVRALDFVERLEPFHGAYRIEPELLTWLDGPGPDELRVNVMAFEWGTAGKERIADEARTLGARLAHWIPSGHRFELWVDRASLRALATHPDVAWIDRWTPNETDMDLVRQDAGTDWLEAETGNCGQGVRGEVMDAGFQLNHPDFDGILAHGQTDVASHGTSTFGIVFGNGNRDGDGNAQGTGHMPCAEQGIAADYGYVGDRFAHTEELKNAPYYASFQTNSWGGGRTTSYNSQSSEIDDIIFRLDIAILQSQSNAGTRSSRPQAWGKNIISVGGIRHYNTLDTADDRWSGGASIGPAADGRIKPDVNYWYDSIYTTTTNSGYTSGFGGTSAATPEAAGVLGLMVQMWSDNVWNTDPVGTTVFERQPHAQTMKALLINNANQYPFTGTTSDLTRVHQGWGRPSARLARERAATSFIVDETDELTVGQTASYDVRVLPGETELKITMAYPDPPGTTSSTLHRINDVNLRVTSPSGTVYHGNVGLDAGNYSVAGGDPNGVDTVENVFVENPEEGLWTVAVEAAEVNADGHLDTAQDDVVFALVVTGAGAGGTCGNDIRETGEECDGPDLAGLTCSGLGCDGGGVLSCNTDCTFDLTACAGCPVCGDGNCDFGENCDRCAADCISEGADVCGNGLCEAFHGEDCLTCPEDCGGTQNGKPANRFCCGAGGGEKPVGCSDSRCTAGVLECTDVPQLAYCCGDDTCEGAEDVASCAVDCTPPSPGEAGANGGSPLLVTGYDSATDTLSLSYEGGCSTTDHVIEYGDLDAVASHTWSGQECGIGTSGAYDWNVTGTPGSMFFVIVGTNGSSEGSYGRDSDGVERPEDVTSASCPVPQELTFRCD